MCGKITHFVLHIRIRIRIHILYLSILHSGIPLATIFLKIAYGEILSTRQNWIIRPSLDLPINWLVMSIFAIIYVKC